MTLHKSWTTPVGFSRCVLCTPF